VRGLDKECGSGKIKCRGRRGSFTSSPPGESRISSNNGRNICCESGDGELIIDSFVGRKGDITRSEWTRVDTRSKYSPNGSCLGANGGTKLDSDIVSIGGIGDCDPNPILTVSKIPLVKGKG